MCSKTLAFNTWYPHYPSIYSPSYHIVIILPTSNVVPLNIFFIIPYLLEFVPIIIYVCTFEEFELPLFLLIFIACRVVNISFLVAVISNHKGYAITSVNSPSNLLRIYTLLAFLLRNEREHFVNWWNRIK